MRSPFTRTAREDSRRQTVANVSALSVIALGVVGGMLGTGAASTAIGVSDGMTWLPDARSGEVLQYNPSTKKVERVYRVGEPGDAIAVSQDSGIVALRNERTGDVITVDMSRLRSTGARATGAQSKVLVAKGMMMLIDRERGVLRRIDPVQAGDLGHPWHSPAPVADAVADQQGTVWVISADGKLRALAWNDQAQRFDQKSVKQIDRVADDGLLAAHEAGVTVFGPRAGVISQVGTPNDSHQQSNQLIGVAPQTTEGPSGLVAGALPNQSAVVLLDRGQVRQVSTVELGCARPIDPAAFHDRVYVVCQGSSKVIQLTREGRVAGPEIATPGSGDAQPVADEGRLVLNVSGAREGIEIDRAGSDQRFDRTPETGTQMMRVEPNPANQGMQAGRQQARADLATEPLPGQPESGSGNVETSPDNFETRTEVIDGGGSRSEPVDQDVPVPETSVEIPVPAAPEPSPEPTRPEPGQRQPQQTEPGQGESQRPDPRRAAPGQSELDQAEPEQPGQVSGQDRAEATLESERPQDPRTTAPPPESATPHESEPSTTRPDDPAAAAPRVSSGVTPSEPVSSGPETRAAAPAEPETRAAVPAEPETDQSATREPATREPAPGAPVPSGFVASNAAPDVPQPSRPAPRAAAPSGAVPSPSAPRGPGRSRPMPSGPTPTGPVPAPTGSAADPNRFASPAGLTSEPSTTSRTTTASGTTRSAAAAPDRLRPARTTSQATTAEPSAPLGAPRNVNAEANGNSVTTTWSYSGDPDRFDVNVGGRSVQVVGTARTATVTGASPGALDVTVNAVRGSATRAASTTVSVGSTATTTPSPSHSSSVEAWADGD